MAIFTVFNEDIYILSISKPFPHHIIKCNCIFKPLHGKPKTFLQVIGGFGAHNNNNYDMCRYGNLSSCLLVKKNVKCCREWGLYTVC